MSFVLENGLKDFFENHKNYWNHGRLEMSEISETQRLLRTYLLLLEGLNRSTSAVDSVSLRLKWMLLFLFFFVVKFKIQKAAKTATKDEHSMRLNLRGAYPTIRYLLLLTSKTVLPSGECESHWWSILIRLIVSECAKTVPNGVTFATQFVMKWSPCFSFA